MASLKEDKALLLRAVQNFISADKQPPFGEIDGKEFGNYLARSQRNFTPDYYTKIQNAADRYFGNAHQVLTRKDWNEAQEAVEKKTSAAANVRHFTPAGNAPGNDWDSLAKLYRDLDQTVRDSQKSIPPELMNMVKKYFRGNEPVQDVSRQISAEDLAEVRKIAHGKDFITREDAFMYADQQGEAIGNQLTEQEKLKIKETGVQLIFGDRNELDLEQYIRNRDAIDVNVLEKQKGTVPPNDKPVRRAQPVEKQTPQDKGPITLDEVLKQLLNGDLFNYNNAEPQSPVALNNAGVADKTAKRG